MVHDLATRLVRFGARYIDYRMAVIGAVIMGGLVFAVNLSYGPGPAGVAAAKQATYTFFFAGLVMRTCERLAVSIQHSGVAIATAFVLPSCMAVGFTFAVHSLRGTPDPMRRRFRRYSWRLRPFCGGRSASAVQRTPICDARRVGAENATQIESPITVTAGSRDGPDQAFPHGCQPPALHRQTGRRDPPSPTRIALPRGSKAIAHPLDDSRGNAESRRIQPRRVYSASAGPLPASNHISHRRPDGLLTAEIRSGCSSSNSGVARRPVSTSRPRSSSVHPRSVRSHTRWLVIRSPASSRSSRCTRRGGSVSRSAARSSRGIGGSSGTQPASVDRTSRVPSNERTNPSNSPARVLATDDNRPRSGSDSSGGGTNRNASAPTCTARSHRGCRTPDPRCTTCTRGPPRRRRSREGAVAWVPRAPVVPPSSRRHAPPRCSLAGRAARSIGAPAARRAARTKVRTMGPPPPRTRRRRRPPAPGPTR